MVTSVYDGVRLAAYAVVVLVLAFQKTKTVLLADAIFASSVVGMMLFKPRMLEYQVTQSLDDMHIFLQQCAASFALLFVCFYVFFLRPAKDNDAKNGYLVCRTIACGLLTIVTAINEWRFSGIFKDTHFPVLMLMYVLWTCLLAYHLSCNGINAPRRGRIAPINFYIKIDVVLALLLSVPDLLFAQYDKNLMSYPLDNLHLHMAGGIAAIHLASAIFGVYALGFRNVTERKGYLCCRLTAITLMALSFICLLFVKKAKLTTTDTAFTSLLFVPIIPAITGLLLTSDKRTFSSTSGGYNLRKRN